MSSDKVEEKKTTSKGKEEEGWEEEQIVETTMQVSVAGRLTREEESKDDGEDQKAAWGSAKAGKAESVQALQRGWQPALQQRK